MEFTRLLAKSTQSEQCPQPEETLTGHTARVMEAASILYTSFCSELPTFLGSSELSGLFESALISAAWLHDLGKANSHFQETVRDPRIRQGVRHETLGLVIIEECLREPLNGLWKPYPAWYKSAVLYSVAGHHLQFPDDPAKQNRPKRDVHFLAAHSDLISYWNLGTSKLKLPPWQAGKNLTFSLMPFGGIWERIRLLRRRLDLDLSPEQKLFVAALKSTLMAADLAGSALPARSIDISAWLQERLKATITGLQLEAIVIQKVGSKPFRVFQETLAGSAAHTVLVEAGCGSGKTVGAYRWCTKKAEGRRLFFCYPTTATASEGFSGYLQDPDFDTLLVHSKSDVDYRLLQDMPEESETQRELRSLKLEALETWPVPAVVCTAHTVLGLLQNVRRSLYAWPSLVRSVFVFDEVHSYSPKLFRHLLRFLSSFRSQPVLLMTATLPPERKRAIEETCVVRGGLQVIEGPREREASKRYTLQRSSEEEAWQATREVLDSGGKVLWVSNTVDRAMDRTRHAQDCGLPVEPYHSRFRYRDRVVRHRRVIDGFKPDQPPLLATTTQVAEMSLDLSADLLVTEYAPVPSLIQRLGRLNRFEDTPTETRQGLFIRPENAFPYASTQKEADTFWEDVERWLEMAADGLPKSQRELADAFIQLTKGEHVGIEDDLFCDWLDDPWSSLSDRHALMEAGYTLEVVREEDVQMEPLQENVIPMPFPRDKSWLRWPRKGRFLVAPEGTIDYDPFWGGRYAGEKPLFRII